MMLNSFKYSNVITQNKQQTEQNTNMQCKRSQQQLYDSWLRFRWTKIWWLFLYSIFIFPLFWQPEPPDTNSHFYPLRLQWWVQWGQTLHTFRLLISNSPTLMYPPLQRKLHYSYSFCNANCAHTLSMYSTEGIVKAGSEKVAQHCPHVTF